VLVVGDSLSNLTTVPNSIAALKELNLPGVMHIILNHTRSHALTYETVMQTLNMPLAADVPYEPAQADAIARGLPLIMSQPGSLFSRTLLNLARQL
jgi:MinD-like ATPase involved in chromosome partitioning or flagellar assembly